MRILVAIDESQTSEAALAAISQHNWSDSTDIKLLYVIDNSQGVLKKLSPSKQASNQDIEQTTFVINQISENFQARVPHCSVTSDVIKGDPKSQIAKYAKQWKAELIVVGTSGKTGIDKILLGSVSQNVLQKSDCPVLIIKDGPMADHIKQGEDFKRILIASDGKESSKAAFSWLAQQNWADDTVYKVMSVIPEESSQFSKENDAQKAAWLLRQWTSLKQSVEKGLRQDASKLGVGLDNEYISVDVVPGNPKNKVIELAKGWRAELVVTGSQNKSSIEKIFGRSVSQAIASQASCSVLVIKGLNKDGKRMSDKQRHQADKANQYLPEIKEPKPRDYQKNDSEPPFKMF